MKVLIIGKNGYVAKNLVAALKNNAQIDKIATVSVRNGIQHIDFTPSTFQLVVYGFSTSSSSVTLDFRYCFLLPLILAEVLSCYVNVLHQLS